MPRGLVDAAALHTSRPDRMFDVPTIHVHGLHDPGLALHRKFAQRYFHPDRRTVLEWEGGHRMPVKSKYADALAEITLETAQATDALELPPVRIPRAAPHLTA